MSKEPSGNIVFDTGVFLEIANRSDNGGHAKELLESGKVRAFANEINIAELTYLICRKVGKEKSEQAIKDLLESGYISVSSFAEHAQNAADMKCERSLAFSDCFVLAMGEAMKIPVLFASRERELMKEISKEPFKTSILFLPDIELKETTRRLL
jgi:uncharacterized protein